MQPEISGFSSDMGKSLEVIAPTLQQRTPARTRNHGSFLHPEGSEVPGHELPQNLQRWVDQESLLRPAGLARKPRGTQTRREGSGS